VAFFGSAGWGSEVSVEKLFDVYRERLALWNALSESGALLVGVIIAGVIGSHLGLMESWNFPYLFAACLTLLVTLEYLGGFCSRRVKATPWRIFLRLSLSVLIIVIVGSFLGASLPPAEALLAFAGIAMLFAMIAIRIFSAEPVFGPEEHGRERPLPRLLQKRVLLVLGGEPAPDRTVPSEDDAGYLHPFAKVCGRIRIDPPQACSDKNEFAALAGQAAEIVTEAQALKTSMVVIVDDSWSARIVQLTLLLRYSGLNVVAKETLVQQQKGIVVLKADDANLQADLPGIARHTLIARRMLDIVLSGAALVALAPVMLAVAVAVRIDSPGPVIYRQVRVGWNAKPFQVLKFRSMRTDAEADGRARWASKDDQRITRSGRFIRKMRLDELPQLLNVLRGDMSLVGPRPERPEFVEQLRHVIPAYELRHLVRPGLTGWAQINYPYGASVEDAREKLGFDLYYVRECGIGLDLFIIARTLHVLLSREGV
jgi:exopolysaccharide biosynthesis polyprenyl glycosylphosphotransferase